MIELNIKKAINEGTCPICGAINKGFDEFLWWFEREGYHEYSAIESLYNAPFICQKHKGTILNLKDKLNNTFELIIEKDLNFLNRLKHFNAKKINKTVKTEYLCRFCLEEQRIENLSLDIFLKKQNLFDLYINSNALLCRKHFLMILQKEKDNDRAKKFIEKTIFTLDNINKEINLYFKRLDYQAKEQIENERFAYLKALNFYTSKT